MTSHQNQSAKISSIDLTAIARLKKMGGNVLVVKMINLFLENIPQKINIMEQAVRDSDYKSLEMAAHSLKSSAGNLGARKLQQTANEIEVLAQEKSKPSLDQLIELIIAESSKVLKLLINKKSEYI
ncbi:MAG: Hpt domain-containing protein [Fidelibacterota bacterium]